MSRAAEINYRRLKVANGEYEDLITDEAWFLKRQVDYLMKLFRQDFEGADEILDVGAGTCWFGAYVESKYGKKVLSLDISTDVMGLSKDLYGYDGRKFVGEIGELVEMGSSFKVICCSALLHHLDDLRAFYLKIAELLEPGGLFIAFNEPRSPHFLPLRRVHRLWFGRSARGFGIRELPRTIPEYLDPLPETLDVQVLDDNDKSRRNYEMTLGRWAASLYSCFAQREWLRPIRMCIFPEAIILAMRRKHLRMGSYITESVSS